MEERRKKRVDWLENFKTTFLVREKKKKKKKINIINLLRNESPSISRPFALNALLTFIASNLSQISGKAAKNYGRLEAKLILVYEAKKKNGFNILFLKD